MTPVALISVFFAPATIARNFLGKVDPGWREVVIMAHFPLLS
jgi:hypothetical protein